MKLKTKILSFATSFVVAASAATAAISVTPISYAENTNDISNTYDWGSVEIGGGGFVSGIVTGQKEMYLRTDVGGAYKYNYETKRWEQLFGFLNDNDRGLLSVKGMAIDPTDDNTVYFLCGCAYFSGARTEIIKTTDGGETFERIPVTDLIQVHGNGDGRECSEPIAVDPDNPDTIYAGGDVASGSSALIKSTDGGKTWKSVDGYDKLGFFKYTVNWPFWDNHPVRAATTEAANAYNEQNGVSNVYIEDGKVYVGTSINGEANVHVADVDKDEFSVLSKDLPTANYPVTISSDNNGNLFITYIAGLAFSGGAGGAYKYNIASGKVTDISPSGNAIGMITADKNDPNKLLARTCGAWLDQWYEKEWTDNSIAWGDYFFRSTDGGASWTNITPGKGETIYDSNGSHKEFISLPIDTNGYKWVYKKACHWGSGILIDPRNPDKILMTSGNGVFACDNVWAEKEVQFYFDPAGVEEVVALDMVSVPGGNPFSAIGDYDGYEHTDVNEIGLQYTPNMGSTSSISYCPQDPKVMARFSEGEKGGYYSTDGGKTWTEMKNVSKGGKSAIVMLEDNVYRIIKSTEGGMSYSDDFGGTWNSVSLEGMYRSCTPYPFANPDDSKYVYAYGYSKPENEYDPTKPEYKLYVSSDYGKTFSAPKTVCTYDYCDAATRIAYDGNGGIFLGGGWNGLYHADMDGSNVTSCNVFYCKTVGYGAPEKDGGLNTLFMYGKPQETDVEGIYRSTDGGKTWVCINTDNLYGGTGNGNFLVGDMNEFGMVYMSTVGCGIVYGRLSDNPKPPKPTNPTDAPTTEQPTTQAPTTTTEQPTTQVPTTTTEQSTTQAPTTTTEQPTTQATTTTTQQPKPTDPTSSPTAEILPSYTGDPKDLKYGDVNLDNAVTNADTIKLIKYQLNGDLYPVGKGDDESIAKAKEQADVKKDGILNTSDSIRLNEFNLKNYTEDQLGKP